MALLSSLLLRSIACWRLTYLLVNEDGLFDLAKKLREFTGIRHDEDGNIIDTGRSPLFCMYCTSIWTALILLMAPEWVSKVFAISGLAMIIEKRR